MDDKQIILAFGQILKEAREKKGITQETLAHSIQSHPTHISRLENGHKQPTLTTIFKLAKELGLNPVYLIQKVQDHI